MKTKYTKGEWKTQPCYEGIEIYNSHYAICRLPKGMDKNRFAEVEANAKLISAAPDLLEALHNTLSALISFIGDEKQANEWVEVKQAKEVIKKALD